MYYLGCHIISEPDGYWVFNPSMEFLAITDTMEQAEAVVHQWERDTDHLVLGSRY